MKFACLCLVSLVLVFMNGCGGNRGNDLNVVLITLDTTRADRFSVYGYPEPTTPHLDQLASEGSLFEAAFSTAPITLPSHTSIMTGTYPMFHGTRDNSTYVVREEVTTMAEVFAEKGYDTGAVVGSFVLDSQFNLDQGFSLYDDDLDEMWSKDELEDRAKDAFGFAERKANLVTATAREWLRKPRSKPFFLWLHYFDPHQPVNPPEPHHSRFTEPYCGELAYADEQIGHVFEELKKQGVYDRTLIVVTADHGEGLLDHGEPTHSLLIFDSTIHVPLIVRMPDSPEGQRFHRLTSTVDILPTVMDLLGFETPSDVQGRSFAELVKGAPDPPPNDRPIYMETMVPELDCGWGALRGIRTAEWKLIHGPIPRLYHVGEDPGEIYDLASQKPEDVETWTRELQGRIDLWAAEEAIQAVNAPDAETLQKLASLGYIGSGGTDRISENLADVEGKPDPYENRWLFEQISSATEDLRTGQELAGVRKLEGVLQSDPRNPMALLNLGKAYLAITGQVEKSIDCFKRCIEFDPNQEDAHYYMARIERSMGNLDAAASHAEAILAVNPYSVPALYEMAGIKEALRDSEGARAHLEALLGIDPTSVPALLEMGVSFARQGMHEESGEYLRQARNIEPQNPQVLYNVGVWYMVTDNPDEAIITLDKVVSLDPDHRDASYVLGKLYYEKNEREKARPYLLKAKTVAVTDDRLRQIDAMLMEMGS
jgi:arylsulfatase A-like enzyme/Tfp pilus assembly protein PilF